MYHSGDWLTSDWQIIDTDQDGTDGWGITLDANVYPEEKGAAFFANFYDWAGNWAGTGIWEIGFDRTAPDTNILTLEPNQQSTAIELQWTATDNISGIDYYQLQSKIGTGNWSNLPQTPSGSQNNIWFVGQPGTEYSFRMRGLDLAGNLEAFPATPETTTSIPAPATLCSTPDDRDTSGDDNSPENSTHVDLPADPTIHNFCNPLSADRLDDEDWVDFEVEIGQAYFVQSVPLAAMTSSDLELYSSDGTTMIASAQPNPLTGVSRIIWTADSSGKVYLRVRHTNGAIAGNIVSYQLLVNKFLPSFFPLINK
jgi:hypothetical protein